MTEEERKYWTKRAELLTQRIKDYNKLVNINIDKEREILELSYILKGINDHLSK